MFEKIGNFFNKLTKPEVKELTSKDAAKERLHLVLMQDRANVSVDFLELMKQEIIDVIKKYIVVDESAIDVRLTNQENEDGTNGAPSLYANIPIINIKNEVKAEKIKDGTLMYENGELEKSPETVTAEASEVTTVENEVAQEEVAESSVVLPEEKTEEIEAPEVNEEPVVEEKMEVIELGAGVEEISETVAPETVEETETIETVPEEVNEELVIEQEEEEVAIEPVVDFPEDEEIDDEDSEDVTFDDLLKKAEEEEQEQEQAEEENDNKVEEVDNTVVEEKPKSAPKKKKSTSKKKKR